MKRTPAITNWRSAVRSALEAAASDDDKKWGEKYFLGAIKFIGVKAPRMKVIERELRPTWSSAPVDEQATFGFVLQTSPFMEERQLGQIVLERVVRKLEPLEMVRELEPIFDENVRDWATCDALAGRVLRRCLVDEEARKRIVSWSKARSTWRQRASAVAFVNEAKHGQYDRDILEVCERIVNNRERFVQLGCGWLLRELSLHDLPRVLRFLDDYKRELSAEDRRYAIEKMPASAKAATKAAR